jgi:cytochrome b561
MPFRNTKRSWGSLSKALHWLIVLLIINQWVIAERADDLTGFQKFTALNWHKWFGMTIFMLAIVRLLWRLANPVPDLTAETRPWERVLARISHFVLYALIFAMPMTGWLMSSARSFSVSYFGLFTLPDLIAPSRPAYERLHDFHEFMAYTLATLAVIHIAAALKHHFFDRDDVLRRMLPLPDRTPRS